ncbi:MAG: hypothetical protein HQK49_19905 [Oligoflexia bacterium]|nr:hypothetical protein [Oligoflexia bacterium]
MCTYLHTHLVIIIFLIFYWISLSDKTFANNSPSLSTEEIQETKQDISKNEVKAGNKRWMNSPHLFWNIFQSYAIDEFGYTDEQAKQLLYFPNKKILSLLKDTNSSHDLRQEMENVKKELKKIKPSELYKISSEKMTNYHSTNELENYFNKSGPITFIILQGYSAEFYSNVFPEVFPKQNNSIFSKYFSDKFNSIKNQNDKNVLINSFAKENPVPVSLDQLVTTSSIDGKNGKPLINLIRLEAGNGNLVTIGNTEDNSKEYLPVIDKLFKTLGEEKLKNVYLLGYSQGSPVALDLIVKAKEQISKYPWAQNLKGVISMAGVNFGVTPASLAFPDNVLQKKDKHPFQQFMELLKEFGDNLKDPVQDSCLKNRLTTHFENFSTVTSTIIKIINKIFTSGLLKKQNPLPGLKIEKIGKSATPLPVLLKMFYDIVFKYVAILESDKSDKSNKSNHDLSKIKRLKMFIKKFSECIQGLSIGERINWWENHKLPNDIKLISLAATQADITEDGTKPSPILDNKITHTRGSVEYNSLRKEYYNEFAQNGMQLNDGSIALDRTVFWPKYIKALNPDFNESNFLFAGIAGTDHGGVALPATVKKAKYPPNPYPRKLLLKSLGTLLAKFTEM